MSDFQQLTVDLEMLLTSEPQSSHTSLTKAKEHDFASFVPAPLNQIVFDKTLQHGRSLFKVSICVETSIGRVEDDVVAPVTATQVEQSLWALDRDTCCLWQVQLLPEFSEGVMCVSESVKEHKDVCWRVAVGRWQVNVSSTYDRRVSLHCQLAINVVGRAFSCQAHASLLRDALTWHN